MNGRKGEGEEETRKEGRQEGRGKELKKRRRKEGEQRLKKKKRADNHDSIFLFICTLDGVDLELYLRRKSGQPDVDLIGCVFVNSHLKPCSEIVG